MSEAHGDSVGTLDAKKEKSGKRVKVKGWPGYVRDGVFIIEKRIDTVKYHVSTRCTSLRAALKHLERFELDPAAYTPVQAATDAVVLTEKMVDEFHEWHLKRVTRHWALNVRSLLIDWANHLKGADLRKLDAVRDLKPHVDGNTQRHHRVKAIRDVFKWLRTERGLLKRAEDASLDLPVPVIQPAQNTKSKAVPWANVVAVARHLPPHVRDVLELLAATGWHVAEVRRFATDGTLRERNATDEAHVVAVMGVKHKSGRRHFTALVHQQHFDVAKRVKERKKVVDNNRLRKFMLRAVEKANKEETEAAKREGRDAVRIDNFQLGAMRHSLATWLTQEGVPLRDTSRFLGHSSETTTNRHYVDHQAAVVVLPARVLRVVG